MSWHSEKKEASSAVLDMSGTDNYNEHPNDFTEIPEPEEARSGDGKRDKGLADDLKEKMSANMTQMVWNAGTQGAKRAWSLYGNIDFLRPYFDVEPKIVEKRLLYSLIPSKLTADAQPLPKELYGPTMVVLTLIALLLYQMKTADHKVEEGTLMGSAFAVCFFYWFGASAFVWFVSFLCNVRMALLQILCMMGYALFGHCFVLFLGTLIHTSHDHMFFYLLWAVLGGLSSCKMASIIMSRTRGSKERIVVIGVITGLHLLFLLYLHFAYHTIVEEISDALNQNLAPVAAEMVKADKPAESLANQALDHTVLGQDHNALGLPKQEVDLPDSKLIPTKSVEAIVTLKNATAAAVKKGADVLLGKMQAMAKSQI